MLINLLVPYYGKHSAYRKSITFLNSFQMIFYTTNKTVNLGSAEEGVPIYIYRIYFNAQLLFERFQGDRMCMCSRKFGCISRTGKILVPAPSI